MKKNIWIKFIPFAMLVLALAGLADATYLTRAHYQGLALGCVAFSGCEEVTASQYATIGNVPVALLGAFYYSAVFALILLYFIFERRADQKKKSFILSLAGKFTAIGFVVSLFFVYLQIFVIKAICTYCMASAFTSTLLFLLGVVILRLQRNLAEEVRAT